MPAATRAEALVGIPEVKDGTLDASGIEEGPAIKARIEQLPHFPPLGPADMLYVRKRYVPVVGAPKIYGYYHFVRAVNASSVAAMSAYIVDVVRNTGLDQSSPGWELASTFGGFEVASATFVAYNFIAKADVFVHVDFPGSTTARATGADGQNVPVDDAFWQELFVSSFVRHLASHGEQPLYPCLRVLSYGSRAETAFLDAAVACVHRWHLSGADTMNGKVETASKSRVAKTIRDHFLRHSRYDAAIEFFSRQALREVDPALVAYAAAAARLKGDLEAAEKLVDSLLTTVTKSALGWMEKAQVFKARGQVQEALEAVKTAAGYAVDESEVWISAADIYVDAKDYTKAFEALNSADMPPPSLDPYLRKLVPNRKNLTSPVEGASGGTDAVLVLAKKMRDERNFSNDKTDGTLTDLPAKRLTDVERDCYDVLVKILQALSWDEMLNVRGNCFVMEADVRDGRLNVSDQEEDPEEAEDASEGEEEEASADERTTESPEADKAQDEANGADNHSEYDGDDERAEGEDGIARIDLNDADEIPENDFANGANNAPAGELKKRALEKIGKQVCKPWLDYLVLNMYSDLKPKASWNAEEQQYAASVGLASRVMARRTGSNPSSPTIVSDDDIEAQYPEEWSWRTISEIVKTTKRPPSDWLHRGELAMRLGKVEEAKTALEVCTKLSEKEKITAVTALLHLMDLAAKDADTKTALRCADAVWTFMDTSTDRKQSSDPSPAVPQVRKAIFKLISKEGLRTVREVVHQVDLDRKRMESLLLDSVALGVHGFSR